jgi:hypothetical protein
MSLLAPHVFLQMSGFYLLGRVLFRNRLWALFLAVITLVLVKINLGTYWGAFKEPLPRFTFQAFLPFVLALAIHWRNRPSRWPLLMTLTGLLMYVHPVSTPPWAFAIWLGLWADKAPGSTIGRRLGQRLLAAAAFLTATAPFVYLYVSSQTYDAAQASSIASAMKDAVPHEYKSIWDALTSFVRASSTPPRPYFVAAAALGIPVLWFMGGRERALVNKYVLWIVGILAVAVGLAWADQSYAAAHGRAPLQIDLIRGIRYLIPLVLLGALWPLAAIDARMAESSAATLRWGGRCVVLAVGAALTVFWVQTSYRSVWVTDAADCWNRGKMACPGRSQEKLAGLSEAIRENTPEGALIITTMPSLVPMIRWHSQRSIAHDWRDLSVFLYSRRDQLAGWNQRSRQFRTLEHAKSNAARFAGVMDFGADLEADYALIHWPYMAASFPAAPGEYEGYELVWRDREFGLMKLAPGPD